MKVSIRTKIILTFTALMAIVLVAQLIFNSFFAEEFYTNYKENSMIETAKAIEAGFIDDYETIEMLVEGYENQHSMNIIIFFNQSIFYMTTNKFIGSLEDVKYNYEADIDIEGLVKNAPDRHGLMPQNKDGLELRESFSYGDSTVSVFINVPAESITDSVSVFSNASLMITLAVFLIGFVACLLVSNSITKPIRETLRVTNKLAKLEFSDSVCENVSSTELSGLAIGINEMSSKLRVATEELYSANEKLKADIDYQKKVEDMRREFIANVSHEMKTPLALMQIYADNLKSELPGIDKDYYHNTIIEECQSLSEMLSSLLDISSIENGLMIMDLKEGSLTSVCENCLQKLEPILEKFNLVCDIEEDVNAVFDQKYIEMAIKNYIVNASEHTKEGDTIKISLDENRLFTVYNDGEKLDEDDFERIWESFYRADKSHNRGNKNIGLGLSIVKAVIDGHNGKYSVGNIDNGVLFSFEI